MATPNTSGSIARITKEIAHIQRGTDLSLGVGCRDNDVRHVRALIIGPPETPYEFGFFEYDVKFAKDYPISSPSVRCITTGGGKCRFNPNIYNCGKVCLSILGTWRGEPGESWSSAQGLESVMLSIQSLMSANPYENEPGYEDQKNHQPLPKAYVEKIRHETLRIAVVQRLEGLLGIDVNRVPPVYKRIRDKTQEMMGQSTSSSASSVSSPDKDEEAHSSTPSSEKSAYEYDAEAAYNTLDSGFWDPFADLIKRRFLWYYDTYAKAIETESPHHQDGEKFQRMEFEFPPNSMEGTFAYNNLAQRLDHVAAALEEERKAWAKAGATQVRESTQLAVQLAFQFKQLEHTWNHTQTKDARMELSLPDPSNPFVWTLTLFGQPMTNLDGGIFALTLAIPPSFPESQPRLKFDTPIFHHRVGSLGYLCYFPEKPEEIGSHLDAIVHAVQDENPTFDPRAVVNPGAFALFWGGEEKRKFYNRKLRRSAADSYEG